MNTQEFKWDDNKVKEFWMGNTLHDSDDSLNAAIDKFKASKAKLLEYEIISIYIDQTPMFPIKPIFPVNGKIRLLIGTKEYSETIEDCFKINECVKIFSVKRLIDNIIFSIKDETIQGEIVSFGLDNQSGLHVYINSIQKCGYNYPYKLLELSKIEPKKQPILVTEDISDSLFGKNLFLVHLDWSITENSYYNEFEASICKSFTRKYFFTKEEAEKYVNLNKPCLSVLDVSNKFSHVFYNKNVFMEELIELAKPKNL